MLTIDEIVLAKKGITEEPKKKKKKVHMFQQFIIDKEFEQEIKK